MRRSYLIGLALVLAASMVLLYWTSRSAPPAAAQIPQMHLDLASEQKTLTLPGDCSTWHELYPNYCINHHQSGYEDNGDGVVSACDYIWLDGVRYHITWVGPTYYTDDGHVYEPEGDPSGNPVCQYWHWIYPNYCTEVHIQGWMDANGNAVVDACDMVQIGGQWVHVVNVGLDITVEPGPTATDESSWGKIKKLFRKLF